MAEPEELFDEGGEPAVTVLEEGKILDDDLPEIGRAYTEFRKSNPEPGP